MGTVVGVVGKGKTDKVVVVVVGKGVGNRVGKAREESKGVYIVLPAHNPQY